MRSRGGRVCGCSAASCPSSSMRANRSSESTLASTRGALGGVLIKIGQFLSTRVDILPAAIAAELAGLQDEVPPAPFAAIQARIAEEFPGGSPFSEVSPRNVDFSLERRVAPDVELTIPATAPSRTSSPLRR